MTIRASCAAVLTFIGALTAFHGAAGAGDDPRERAIHSLLPNSTTPTELQACVTLFNELRLGPHELETLAKIRWARGLIPDHRDPGMDCRRFPDWLALADLGAPLGTLAQMNEARHLEPIVLDFKSGRVPAEFAKRMTTERRMFAYAPAFAAKRAGVPDRAKLKVRLRERKHLYRTRVDYREDPDALDNVTNPVLLRLIEAWMDYADSPGGRRFVAELFPVICCKNIERGGIVFGNDAGELEIVAAVPATDDDALSHDRSFIGWYAENLGGIHSHPLSAGFRPEDVSGPSDCGTKPKCDLFIHRYFAIANPYLVDAVATEITDGSWNLDIYFRDVRPDKFGQPENFGSIIVLDLGVFRAAE